MKAKICTLVLRADKTGGLAQPSQRPEKFPLHCGERCRAIELWSANLKQLQDRLGEVNDLEVAAVIIGQKAAAKAADLQV